MSTVALVHTNELGLEFDIGTIEANKIRIKLDASLTRSPTGEIGLSATSLQVVSGDAGNLITVDANGKAFFNQAALQAAETVWGGSSSADGFMTVTPAGVNGHAPTFAFNYANPVFVEAVQDAVGQAILNGAGITYDDVADSISSALGNVAFGNGLNFAAGNVTVLADPASPAPVSVSAAGVSVQATPSTDANNLITNGTDNRPMLDPADIEALGTVILCDSFNNPIANAFAP